ncbi:hypothetical protein [Pseudoalteromonas luteoviolacea]|uniref:Orphan protein n=1 Tax=Pseudoalteromonas luteoviolacea S4054 TaxID=1129367 RepID=A0A0F6AFJ0_9GAMM|nr:hypothetical protein [Pseudoalteromonas luteoviolacea]AOT09304.1 hypothetical protein S4054249_16260 [Pseudoalteromonas luteoviolacea]AOT14216.1 hypothetical protein S40542_16230 [Pseudoalteromonas luteoviolacea]AOT19132.1 hypothetical protein S4054_16235 [Pseudoalteromonas luteoviolacea]KKE84977.1 hypothetical protein N479_05980 [Pseudoalteromonas luteoviolacea S4054]KZN70095.1 hypothetical protein N481_01090 [Pseudoalteromonas luteoviolacea S4047-1]
MITQATQSYSNATQASRPQITLSEQQTSTIKETLEQFDPDNLSEADAQSIVNSFSEAGIKPSKALAEQMSELGFDAKAIGELAGAPAKPPKDKPSAQVDLKQVVEYLSDALVEQDSNQLNDEQKQALLSDLKSQLGLPEDGNLINVHV